MSLTDAYRRNRKRLNHVWLDEGRLIVDAVGAMSSDGDRALLAAADAAWLPIWEKLLAGELTVSREFTEDEVRGLVDVKAIPSGSMNTVGNMRCRNQRLRENSYFGTVVEGIGIRLV